MAAKRRKKHKNKITTGFQSATIAKRNPRFFIMAVGGRVIVTLQISGLLISIGKTSREALISKEPTKFVVKISVNPRCNRVYQK